MKTLPALLLCMFASSPLTALASSSTSGDIAAAATTGQGSPQLDPFQALGALQNYEVDIKSEYSQSIPAERLAAIIAIGRKIGDKIILQPGESRAKFREIAVVGAVENYLLNFASTPKLDLVAFELGTFAYVMVMMQ